MARSAAAERVVAIGTTTLPGAGERGRLGATGGHHRTSTSGGAPLAVVGALLTNFHVPRSSLLVLVDALVGPRWRARSTPRPWGGLPVLSFGDAMFCPGRPRRGGR